MEKLDYLHLNLSSPQSCDLGPVAVGWLLSQGSTREIGPVGRLYIKVLAYVIVGAGKSEICREGHQEGQDGTFWYKLKLRFTARMSSSSSENPLFGSYCLSTD